MGRIVGAKQPGRNDGTLRSHYDWVIPAARRYFQSKGADAESADEFAHEFFSVVVLHRGLSDRLSNAGTGQRSLLRKALRDFRIEQIRRTASDRRRLRLLHGSAPTEFTADEYDRRQVLEVVREALRRTEADYRERPKLAKHWIAFEERVLRPILYGIPAPAVKDLASKLGLKNGDDVSSLLQQVRRRFNAHLLDLLNVKNPSTAETNRHVQALLSILAQRNLVEGPE